MSLFSSFVLTFGALLALMALIAAWLFRTSAAPQWQKLLVPCLIVALGCLAPATVTSMMGYPVITDENALPAKIEVVAFVPHDEEGTADLWIIDRTRVCAVFSLPTCQQELGTPRSYSIKPTEKMKKALRAARDAIDHGQPGVLSKESAKRKSAGDKLAIGDDDMHYVLDLSALSPLPPKE